MIDFVHSNETGGELEHVVTERDDNELSVLGAFFDVAGYN
jgi:hypothetical protein